jgi:hypothetical protein
VEGDLYFPLCNITIEGDPAVVTLEQIQQGGPIDVVPNLPEMKNIGDKRELLKGRVAAGDTYDFRTIEQIESRGEPVIKPLAEEEEEGNTIKWRRIAERESQPQVTVSTKEEGEEGSEEGLIVIEGNDRRLRASRRNSSSRLTATWFQVAHFGKTGRQYSSVRTTFTSDSTRCLRTSSKSFAGALMTNRIQGRTKRLPLQEERSQPRTRGASLSIMSGFYWGSFPRCDRASKASVRRIIQLASASKLR